MHQYRPGLPVWQGESGAPSKAVAGQALADYEWDEDRQARWDTRRALLDLRYDTTLSAFFHAADFQFYIVKDQYVQPSSGPPTAASPRPSSSRSCRPATASPNSVAL